MYQPLLAAGLQELPETFGLHAEAFIAHCIAFTVLVFIIVKFGLKPVMTLLEERRKRIVEGEEMHARSQKELAEVQAAGEKILDDARESGRKEMEHARATAAKLQDDLSAKASAEAQTVIENARKQAALDTQREKDALKGEFARLVAQATAQVTGKVLTDEDHRRINAEAISHL